jgi:adenylate cyclase
MSDPLAAILSADAVGYSRLMAEDEAGTIRTLGSYRDLISGLVTNHRGRVVDAPGDNLLAEFPNALDTVQCAVETQGVLRVRNQSLPEPRRMLFRMGVHLGDITAEGGRVYGDGVNIAARLEGLAEPGGVCISRSVHEVIQGKLALEFDDLGEQTVKNIPTPVHAYRVRLEAPAPPARRDRRGAVGHWARIAGAIVILLGLGAALWHLLTRVTDVSREQIALEQSREAAEAAPSVAVLLFDNLSGDAATEPFTKGIHDDVLTQISKIRALKVIARTSMERLEPGLSIPEIGRKLGVTTVLEGGVQQAGDRVRVNVQLIDCETEAHLWAETYDRELTAANIFAIQSEIAATVAGALRAALSAEEEESIATVPTQSLAAYQAYLLGKQRLGKATSAALAEAVDYFQRAVELDPGFALAHVGLADAYVWQVYTSELPKEALLERARAAADKALELDERLGEAHSSLAGIKRAMWDVRGAEAAFRRALELSPNYAAAYTGYGELLRVGFGRSEEALPLHEKALELDPLSGDAIGEIGKDLAALGRFDEALAWLGKALEVDPNQAFVTFAVADHYWYVSGQLDQAVVWYEKTRSIDPGDVSVLAGLGMLFLDLGSLDEAEYWIGRSIEVGPESVWGKNALGFLHLYRDDEAAVDYLHRLPAGFTTSWPAHLLRRLHALRAGRYSEAIAWAEEGFPELLNDDSPEIDSVMKYSAAIDLALPLAKLGEQERADLLLERSLQHVQTLPRLTNDGHWVADVQIYALQGEKRKALAALRQAIDEGWRSMWWYFLQREPNLASLHGEPEFQAMVEEIKADMAAQLARVREMERRGELTPIPSTDARP